MVVIHYKDIVTTLFYGSMAWVAAFHAVMMNRTLIIRLHLQACMQMVQGLSARITYMKIERR